MGSQSFDQAAKVPSATATLWYPSWFEIDRIRTSLHFEDSLYCFYQEYVGYTGIPNDSDL